MILLFFEATYLLYSNVIRRLGEQLYAQGLELNSEYEDIMEEITEYSLNSAFSLHFLPAFNPFLAAFLA